MSEFHTGDRIRIKSVDEMIESGLYVMRSDGCLLPAEYCNNRIVFNGGMQYMCGRTGIITDVSVSGYRYSVDFDDPEIGQGGWVLTDSMMCHDYEVEVDDDAVFAFLDSY